MFGRLIIPFFAFTPILSVLYMEVIICICCPIGVYIGKTTYIRQGEQSLDGFYRAWHQVEYYRYLNALITVFIYDTKQAQFNSNLYSESSVHLFLFFCFMYPVNLIFCFIITTGI